MGLLSNGGLYLPNIDVLKYPNQVEVKWGGGVRGIGEKINPLPNSCSEAPIQKSLFREKIPHKNQVGVAWDKCDVKAILVAICFSLRKMIRLDNHFAWLVALPSKKNEK